MIWPAVFFVALAVGQLLRLQLVPGSTGALSAVDLALIFSIAGYLVQLIRRGRVPAFAAATWRHPVWRWSVLFLGWAGVSLLLNIPDYTGKELAVAGAYLARFGAVFTLGWLVSFDPPPRGYVRQLFAISAAGLLVLGLLQFIFVPDFRFMVQYGWDPHVGRLLSTFFDPNYFGVFLVLAMSVFLAQALDVAGRQRRPFTLLFVASWIALYATYSRSAWLAGLLAIPLVALRRDWRLAALCVAVFIGALFLPTRLGQRFQQAQSLTQAKNYQQQEYRCDETAQTRCDTSGAQRVLSYRRGWELVKSDWLTGVGYNAYGYALVHRGVIDQGRLGSHSAQGSDSSLLTIWATTGIVGLGLFITFLANAALELRRRLRTEPVAIGLLAFTFAWIAVSFFNNAILYVSILAPWMVLLADTLRPTRKATR